MEFWGILRGFWLCVLEGERSGVGVALRGFGGRHGGAGAGWRVELDSRASTPLSQCAEIVGDIVDAKATVVVERGRCGSGEFGRAGGEVVRFGTCSGEERGADGGINVFQAR